MTVEEQSMLFIRVILMFCSGLLRMIVTINVVHSSHSDVLFWIASIVCEFLDSEYHCDNIRNLVTMKFLNLEIETSFVVCD